MKKGEISAAPPPGAPVDCGCVIWGRNYDWDYVERLYNGLRRGLSRDIRLHVWTEHDRSVPPHMIKHVLEDLPELNAPKKAWWYKLQMFDPAHFSGRLIYLDLDVIVTGDLGWMLELDPAYFWTLRDFRYLWRSSHDCMNSSVMIWDTLRFRDIWADWRRDYTNIIRRYDGDQDWINQQIPAGQRRYIESARAQSWRWQVLDGGLDPKTRRYRAPDTGPQLDAATSLVIFHGRPKPHQISHQWVSKHWT